MKSTALSSVRVDVRGASRLAVFGVALLIARGASAQTPAVTAPWQAGAFVDLGSLRSLNAPPDHLFRTRGTTPRLDEININMAGIYVRRAPTKSSRWGLEATAHGGEDSRLFGFSATARNLRGAETLRRLGPTNVSYLVPAHDDLTLQAGIFSSFIGYDSLYAKDNASYTRPWTADFTPYLMLGVNASYPVTENLAVTAAVVNGYWHLAHANDVPSVGGQVVYKVRDTWTVKQAFLYGPHQRETAWGFWRWLSNTIVERRTERVRAALDFHVSTERVADDSHQRAWWVAAQTPVRVTIRGPWSVTLRPEVAWDSAGRWTTLEQNVFGMTSSVSYDRRMRLTQAIVRFEHRFDRSTGPQGGFFKTMSSGLSGTTPNQHLFVINVIVAVHGAFGGAQ